MKNLKEISTRLEIARKNILDRKSLMLWSRILERVKEAVLWLQAKEGPTRENLKRAAAACGIPKDRLFFAEPERMSERWRHRLADIWLDTLCLSGGTAGVLCAWVGLPVVTMAGPRTQDRNGATVARALGLGDLVVETIQAYEDRAVFLAQNETERAQLRERLLLAKTSSKLFDSEHLTQHLERAYFMMWERFRQDLAPAPIQVPRIGSIEQE